jgi:hypothetical protein
VAFLPCVTVDAEELEKEFREHIAKLREQQKIAATPESETSNAVVPASHQPNDPEMFNIPAASHVRSNEGIPFPQQSELVLDPEPPAYMEVLRASKQPYIPKPKMPYVRPGKCEANQTKRIPLVSPVEGEERVLSDVVYLPQELIPMDANELYGEHAKLWGYGPNGAESVYTRMETHAVPCVPYRFRVTTKANYEDSGVNALKNYDKNPSGDGILNSWVQEQLYGRKPNVTSNREGLRPSRRR